LREKKLLCTGKLCPLKIKKVVVIGPECTGKSDLSEFLATEFKTVWVEEYARRYLSGLQVPYGPADLVNIANGQLQAEDSLLPRADKILICDTNLYVIKIWSIFKYGYCDPVILKAIDNREYDLYLLTYIDIPWEYDPLREHPDQREKLYHLYLNEMKNQSVPFTEIKGPRHQRRKTAIESVQKLLHNNSRHPL
jgi:NadR type nicotinamide-nucleotide adenylyltransferase